MSLTIPIKNLSYFQKDNKQSSPPITSKIKTFNIQPFMTKNEECSKSMRRISFKIGGETESADPLIK